MVLMIAPKLLLCFPTNNVFGRNATLGSWVRGSDLMNSRLKSPSSPGAMYGFEII